MGSYICLVSDITIQEFNMKKESVLIICLFLGNSFTENLDLEDARAELFNSTKLFSSRANTFGPCPQFKDLATTYSGRTICAYYWKGPGDDWPINSCNGDSVYMLDGIVKPSGSCIPMGSYWVMPGCTLYLFQNGDWTGNRGAFTAGLNPLNTFRNSDSCWGPGALKCSCDSSPFNCIPEDGWETVFSYDNSQSSVTVSMQYEKSIGTTHSETVTNSISQSITVEAEISAAFEGIFSASLGVSSTTGFDWSNAFTGTFAQTTSFTEQITIRPGKKVVIQQVVGSCGFSKVRTTLFRALE